MYCKLFEANFLFWLGITFPSPFHSVDQLNKAQLYKPVITSHLPNCLPQTPPRQTYCSVHRQMGSDLHLEVSRIKSACFPDTSAIPVAPVRVRHELYFQMKNVCKEGGSLKAQMCMCVLVKTGRDLKWCRWGSPTVHNSAGKGSRLLAPQISGCLVSEGARVEGQCADSAAGYCPSKTLPPQWKYYDTSAHI